DGQADREPAHATQLRRVPAVVRRQRRRSEERGTSEERTIGAGTRTPGARSIRSEERARSGRSAPERGQGTNRRDEAGPGGAGGGADGQRVRPRWGRGVGGVVFP